MTTEIPSAITNADMEHCLKKILKEEGYSLGSKKGLDKLGPDIKATKDKEKWYIEITGYGETGIEKTGDFYRAFFQAISRLNNKGCRHVVIAMPESSRKILPIRAKAYKVAWKRIAESFPELEIWLVDVEGRKYQRTPWSYWLKSRK